jgi:hypothetical protein
VGGGFELDIHCRHKAKALSLVQFAVFEVRGRRTFDA